MCKRKHCEEGFSTLGLSTKLLRPPNVQKLLSKKKHSGKGFLGVWGPITLLDYLLHMIVGTSSVRKPSIECFTFLLGILTSLSNLCKNLKATKVQISNPFLLPSSSINDASAHSIDLSSLLLSACLSFGFGAGNQAPLDLLWRGSYLRISINASPFPKAPAKTFSISLSPFCKAPAKLNFLVYLECTLSRVMGKKRKNKGMRGVSKTKKEENFNCLPVPYPPWLYLKSSRHLFEEWPSPHWLVPYTFWCRPFQVYFQVHLLMLGTCSTTIQYELSLQFAQWVHAPKFPSHTNFSILWFQPVLGGYSENPDTSSDIKNWHPVNIIEVIFRLISGVLDIIHHAIRQLNIQKLGRISKVLISSFNIRSKARYQG